MDLTTVPTSAGFWVPWLPFGRPQSWPFCWWVAVIVDHFSRAVVGFVIFPRCPTSAEVRQFLARAIRNGGEAPEHLITDRGSQFSSASFARWRHRCGIQHRFGAIGRYGSLAVIERFIRALKDECTREILVPVRLGAARTRLVRGLVQPSPPEPGTGRSDADGALRGPPARQQPTAV